MRKVKWGQTLIWDTSRFVQTDITNENRDRPWFKLLHV